MARIYFVKDPTARSATCNIVSQFAQFVNNVVSWSRHWTPTATHLIALYVFRIRLPRSQGQDQADGLA